MPLPKLEGFKGSNRTMVFGIEGVSWVVEQQQTATYILECTESQITVPHKTNKVSIIFSISTFPITRGTQ